MADQAHETAHGLLDPRNGYIAEHIRGKQGASEAAEIVALRAEVDALKRALVLLPRVLRAIRLEEHAIEIIPGPDGVIGFSTDDYLQWERNPNSGLHHGKLSLDLDALVTYLLTRDDFLDAICEHCTPVGPG